MCLIVCLAFGFLQDVVVGLFGRMRTERMEADLGKSYAAFYLQPAWKL